MSTKGLTSREKRQLRIRKKIFGTAERPRLNVFRSAKHIYAQVIDDDKGHTLVSASTVIESMKKATGKKSDLAKQVGTALAAACKTANITAVVFDRGGFRYHGRIKAVAEGAREGGLQF
jgi:large subunit ribosomal protein L18